ncbi:MAG TPA: hypothetical protein VGN65_08905 [Casimicrobiaceae bacterium]|jgi:hypothetical protein
MVSPLVAWENFYVIVGSSAAALTGLMFVVIALVAEDRTRSGSREIAAFGTPTVVHFCSALLASALVSAPWQSIRNCGVALSILGVIGVVYTLNVARRARKQTGYQPVFEDWLWHVAFPLCVYAVMIPSAFLMSGSPAGMLFWVGGGTLGLVFIGIHNAWDTVTYVAIERLTRNPPGAE